MSDGKHTPGPWMAIPAGPHDDEVNVVGPTHKLNEDEHWLCQTFAKAGHNTLANARLIAAAPDLLAACKAFDIALCIGSRGELIAAAVLARGAISKAEQA